MTGRTTAFSGRRFASPLMPGVIQDRPGSVYLGTPAGAVVPLRHTYMAAPSVRRRCPLSDG